MVYKSHEIEDVTEVLIKGLKITNPCPEQKDVCRSVLNEIKESLARPATKFEQKAEQIQPLKDLASEMVNAAMGILDKLNHHSGLWNYSSIRVPGSVAKDILEIEQMCKEFKNKSCDVNFYEDAIYDTPFKERVQIGMSETTVSV